MREPSIFRGISSVTKETFLQVERIEISIRCGSISLFILINDGSRYKEATRPNTEYIY